MKVRCASSRDATVNGFVMNHVQRLVISRQILFIIKPYQLIINKTSTPVATGAMRQDPRLNLVWFVLGLTFLEESIQKQSFVFTGVNGFVSSSLNWWLYFCCFYEQNHDGVYVDKESVMCFRKNIILFKVIIITGLCWSRMRRPYLGKYLLTFQVLCNLPWHYHSVTHLTDV